MIIERFQDRHLLWWPFAMMLVALAVLIGVAIGVRNAFWGAPPTVPSSPVAAGSAATQISEGGQVIVKATWNGVNAGPVFIIVMDTHAVDLDGYDLRQLAVLRVDGRTATPSGWDAPKGGHHREGTLTFSATGPSGAPLVRPGMRAIELVIRDVAGVPERVFRWTP